VTTLSQLFPKQILLAYGCPDRLVIRGYYAALQREANIEHFFHNVVGVPVIDSDVLASRTVAYMKWVDRFVKDNRIERVRPPKGARKEDFVRPYYRRLGEREGVACILTSLETDRTFFSYMRTNQIHEKETQKIVSGKAAAQAAPIWGSPHIGHPHLHPETGKNYHPGVGHSR
jgi:hypothetical protein